MIRKLLIVAVSAAVLALVTIGAAIAIGGADLREELSDGHFEWSPDKYDGPVATREFEFDTTKVLTIDMPVELRFERSETTAMTVEGPQELIDALVYEDGALDLKGARNGKKGSLTIRITAPSLAGLHLEAPGEVELVGLEQDSFELESAGAADVTASGKIGALRLEADGAADFDFEEVEARDAAVEINGAGDVDLSATGNVDIEINGAGDVTLHAKPDKLTSEINGIGDVNHSY